IPAFIQNRCPTILLVYVQPYHFHGMCLHTPYGGGRLSACHQGTTVVPFLHSRPLAALLPCCLSAFLPCCPPSCPAALPPCCPPSCPAALLPCSLVTFYPRALSPAP
ncbi:MAG: hypothetical protein FJ149_06595, partial [Euryarchaeota archaeon]|nr:hypothetical protein [Euryarchaeota archaeon]